MGARVSKIVEEVCGVSMKVPWSLIGLMVVGLACRPEAALGQDDLIARRYGVSASDLFNANLGDLQLGDELLLIPTERIAPLAGVEGVVVNLAERAAYLYENGRPVARYPVATGMRGWETPTGDYTIANKAKNPTWFPPEWAVEEEPVPPGPSNPLGDRWLGLSIKGYGIHATNAPWTVGRYLSHGCIRMYPEQVQELYETVKVGTPVKIVYARVVLGYRPEEGAVYMGYYPDPYRIGRAGPDSVGAQLAGCGLEWAAGLATVAKALESPRGVPMRILGSRTRVTVNGKPVEFALGPTRVGGDWLVPAGPLVEAMGAKMEMGPDYVLITRDRQRVFLSPGDPDVIANGELVRVGAAPRMAAGHPLVPLKATAMGLGSSVGWDEWADTALVWDPWELGGLGRPQGVPGGMR